VGEEERNALESGKVVCDAAAGCVPTSQWFPPRGRVTTGSKQSEIFGNGTRCERGHGRIIARKGAGCDGAIDGNGGPRGTGARHAASRGGTLLGHVRIVTVATLRVSDTDISSRYEDDQRLGLAICDSSTGKGRHTEGNVKILRSLLRLDSPMICKKMQANRLVRTLLKVTAGDESEVVRDRAQRTLDNARQMPCLQGMVASFADPVTDAELQTWRIEEWAKRIREETNCAAAQNREGGLFPTSDETFDSKSKTASAQIPRESISCVEHFSSSDKYGCGADDQQVGAHSADYKRGGCGPGSEAHGQIEVFEERCGNGDESAGDAE
jgi:hypothetical protein